MNPDLEQLGQLLLDRGFLLSALELWMESLEHDQPVKCLGQFFAQFRPEKVSLLSAPATDEELNSLDSQQLLMRLKEAEEKISLLRYQLELSKEAEKQQQKLAPPPPPSGIDVAAPELAAQRNEAVKRLEEQEDDVHEQRILQFLLRQYLLAHNYKMTAVTLAEEVQGLPMRWSELGLDLQEAPSLVSMLRYFYSAGAQRVELEIAKQPTLVARLEEKTSEAEHLLRQVEELKHELALAERKSELLEVEKKRMLSAWEHDVEEARRVARKEMAHQEPPSTPQQPTATVATTIAVSESTAPSPGIFQPIDDLDFLFARRSFARQTVAGLEDSTIQELNVRVRQQIHELAGLKLNDHRGLIQVYATSLPHVIPGIILRAREEVVPMLLATIQQVEDERTRGQLTSLLFCLVKKPDASQRNTILHACKVLAELIGRERTERELVPQCWDGMNDKAEERRLLAADFCGVLMPHVRDGRRVPLMLNVLRTLLEDPVPAVRAAASRNMGVLITFTSDVNEHFSELFGHFRKMIFDSDENVGKIALSEVLVKLADWVASDFKLESHLIEPLLRETEQQLSLAQGDRAGLKRLGMLTDAVAALFPFLRRVVLAWAPFSGEVLRHCDREDPKRFVLSQEDESNLQEAMRDFLRHEKDLAFAAEDLKWESMVYICQKLGPSIVAMIGATSLAERRASYLTLVALLDAFWKTFDTACTNAVWKPIFLKCLSDEHSSRSSLLPAYVACIVARGPQPELGAYFSAAVGSGPDHDTLTGLCLSLELLSTRLPSSLEFVLGALRELVVAPEVKVREATATLLDRLASRCTEQLIRQTILPCVANFCNDSESVVRIRAIQVLGSIMTCSSAEKVLEPVLFQLDSLIETGNADVLEAIMVMLTEICEHVDSNFRDRFLLPKIRATTMANAKEESDEKRAKVASSIFTAFKVFLEQGPSMETLVSIVLPSLEVLQKQLVLEENIKSIQAAIATIRIKGGIPSVSPMPVVAAEEAPAAPAVVVSSVPEEKKEDNSTLVRAKNMLDRFKFGKKKEEPPKSDNEK